MRVRITILGLLCAVVLAAAPALAEEPPAPRTAGDAAVDLGVLGVRLKPLRQAQLAAEAEAWAGLLEALQQRIADTQVEIAGAEEGAKPALREALAGLQGEKAQLLKRVNVVLDAWAAKGGDPAELRTYVEQIKGLDISVTDARSALTVISSWITSEEGGIKVGKNILYFLVILLLARIVSNIVGRLVRRGLSAFRQTPELLKNFLSNTVRNVVFIVGVVVAISKLGVNIGPLLAAIGAAGLVIGLALQDTLSNFASGVMILLYRPYKLGDVVSVAGVSGKVEAMTLVSTTIKTFDNQVLVVPNNSIWGQVITNVTGSPTRRVDMRFGIGYEDDIDKATSILEGILARHDKVLDEPAPAVAIAELGASSVDFHVRPWARTEDYWTVYGDVTREVKRKFDAAGISIPYPQQDIHVHGLPGATGGA